MTNKLFLYIKKTNKHVYLYLLHEGVQIYSISTDSRILDTYLKSTAHSYHLETISHILTQKIKHYGFTEIYLVQRNVFHGNIRKIVDYVLKSGIPIK